MAWPHRAPSAALLGSRSIREECSPLLGAEAFDMRVDDLTDRQKYDLVFTRLLLQRPKVVFCIHPFKKAGVAIRSHIWASSAFRALLISERFINSILSSVDIRVCIHNLKRLSDRFLLWIFFPV